MDLFRPAFPQRPTPKIAQHVTQHGTEMPLQQPRLPLLTEAGLLLPVSPVPPLSSAFHSDLFHLSPPLPPPQPFSVHPVFLKGG